MSVQNNGKCKIIIKVPKKAKKDLEPMSYSYKFLRNAKHATLKHSNLLKVFIILLPGLGIAKAKWQEEVWL